MASPLFLLRRPVFSFSVGLLPDSLSSPGIGRSYLPLCRACSGVRGAHGEGPAVKLTTRERRMERTKLLRRNRRDPELEKAARKSTLLVPLDAVQREWQSHRGLDQLQTAGIHFNLYQDLYGGRVFRPLGFMDVVYGEKRVHRGTILTPSETASPPRVGHLPRDKLCSIVLTNPDGHLLDHSRELLHWMVVNIAGGDVTLGQEMVSYLQPVPPQGSGLHRHVFSLFTHSSPITVNTTAIDSYSSWLDKRTFSTAEFLSSQPTLQPFTFSLFQSQWDNSVHTVFMEELVYPEPVYGVEREMTVRQQKQENTRLRKSNHYRFML